MSESISVTLACFTHEMKVASPDAPRSPGKNLSGPLRAIRLTDLALNLEWEDGTWVFGVWGPAFGFWNQYGRGGVMIDRLPIWCSLQPTGLWLENALLPPLAKYADKLLPELHAATSAYFSQIPIPIRRIAAPFGLHQWLAMDAMHHAPHLTPMLDWAGQGDLRKTVSDIFRTATALFEEREQRMYMIERELSWDSP